MTEYIVQDTSLTAVANKIRSKSGSVTPLEFPDEFINEIDTLSNTSDANATAADIRKGKTAYVNAVKLTGTLTSLMPETPTDSILFYSPDAFTLGVFNRSKNWDGSLYYSTDHETWVEWDGSTDITAARDAADAAYLIYLKGSNVSTLNSLPNFRPNARFVITGTVIKCVGNLNTVVTTDPETALASRAFMYIFQDCINIDFDLILPFKYMGDDSYAYMFDGCTMLTKPPSLPATTLASGCYEYMFRNCIRITIAPALNCTTLAVQCYRSMFSGCASLINAPSLPALTCETQSYEGMFQNCTALQIAPSISATTINLAGCRRMFSGCSALSTPPVLSATNLYNGSYEYMFENCTALTTAPALPATTLANTCYKYMFSNCTALINSPALPATTLATDCYNYMFVSCTNLISIAELPALTLVSGCYSYMYNKCTKIKMSTTQTGDYQTEYRIPSSGTGSGSGTANMFLATGGSFKGTPTINTTYYTSNTVISAT